MKQYKVEARFGKMVAGKVEFTWSMMGEFDTERKAWAFVNKARNCGQLRVMKNENGNWMEI